MAIAYAGSAQAYLASLRAEAIVSLPPAGIGLAALLLIARRQWPAVIAAVLVGNLIGCLRDQLPWPTALGVGVATAVGIVVGACGTQWLSGGPAAVNLNTRRGLLRFVGAAALAGPLAAGLLGTAAVAWRQPALWPGLVLQWVARDSLAVLVIGGPVLLWPQRRALVLSRFPELALVVLSTLGLTAVAFRYGEPSALAFLPLLIWATFRLGDLGCVLAGTAFAFVASYLTVADYSGPAHAGLSARTSLALMQLYISLVVVMAWLLAQEIAGRIAASRARESAEAREQRAEAMRLALELSGALADATTVDHVVKQVSASVQARLGPADTTISVLGQDGVTFEVLAKQYITAAGGGQRWTIHCPAPGPRAVRERTPVYVGSTDDAVTASAFPLLTETGSLGYLSVQWSDPYQLTDADRDYLQAVAATTSRALERAQLRQDELDERERLQALSELTGLLLTALTPKAIGVVVGDQVRAAFGGADALALGIVSKDRRQLDWVCTAGYPEQAAKLRQSALAARTPATDVVKTGLPITMRTAEEYAERYPEHYQRTAIKDAASWLAWPLATGRTTIGCIVVTWRRPQQFGPGQLAFIGAVVKLIGQVLARAQRYEEERAIATVLRQAVMPTRTPHIAGLQIGTCYRQTGGSRAVGGDWFDVLELQSGQIYLAVGDVVGHGIGAAEDMTALRNAGRALAIQGHQPGSLLSELGQITATATKSEFATMVVAIVDLTAGLVTYASAGHPPLLIRRAADGSVERPDQPGEAPLGAFTGVSYTQRQASLAAGDLMLLYTDGLVERRGRDVDDGISTVTARLRAWRAGIALDTLCQQLVRSLTTNPQLDDICVLAARRSDEAGPTPAASLRRNGERMRAI